MAVAANYVGHYVLPWDWINHPQEAHCSGKREVGDDEPEVAEIAKRGLEDIRMAAQCLAGGNVVIRVDVGSHNILGVNKVTDNTPTTFYTPFSPWTHRLQNVCT